MMLFPLNVDKIGVKYKKSEFFREVITFKTIIGHEEGKEFYWLVIFLFSFSFWTILNKKFTNYLARRKNG